MTWNILSIYVSCFRYGWPNRPHNRYRMFWIQPAVKRGWPLIKRPMFFLKILHNSLSGMQLIRSWLTNPLDCLSTYNKTHALCFIKANYEISTGKLIMGKRDHGKVIASLFWNLNWFHFWVTKTIGVAFSLSCPLMFCRIMGFHYENSFRNVQKMQDCFCFVSKLKATKVKGHAKKPCYLPSSCL